MFLVRIAFNLGRRGPGKDGHPKEWKSLKKRQKLPIQEITNDRGVMKGASD